MDYTFFEAHEKELHDNFVQNGFVTIPLSQRSILENIKQKIFELARIFLELDITISKEQFFDHTDKYLEVNRLNDLRVYIIAKLSNDESIRPQVYQLCKQYLHLVVGNELCMQRACNLSIQLPNDQTSVLPLHSDVWSGNSPYEVVFWLPFVDCFKTKSMFVLPLHKSKEVFKLFQKYSNLKSEELFKEIEGDLIWPDVPYGHAILFSHSILHGNVINQEATTRWTFNVRFKSLLSPYRTKELGETFLPITLRPATRVGLNHIDPRI